MPRHTVTAAQLNLRSAPTVGTNVIATLPNGQEVEDIDRSNNPWWKVRTIFHGGAIEGFVNSTYLQLVETAPAAETTSSISAVQLGRSDGARVNSVAARAYALGDAAAPKRGAANPTGDLASII